MGQEIDLKEFARKVNEKYPLEFAILFGSRARGDALKSSDYDILFVSKKFHKDIFKRMADMLDLWDEEGSLEPICFTLEEFETALKTKNPIIWESLKDGKVIWGKDQFAKYKKRFNFAVKHGMLDISKTIRFLQLPETIFSSF